MSDSIQDPAEDTTDTAAPPNGRQFAGRYLLKSVLAWGKGPGETWAAQDEEGAQVALHILPAGAQRDAESMAALRKLVKRSRGVIHPGVVRIHELIDEPEVA